MTKEEFAALLLQRLAEVADVDWYLALLSAALDDGRDLGQAIAAADEAFAEQPEAPEGGEPLTLEECGGEGGKPGPCPFAAGDRIKLSPTYSRMGKTIAHPHQEVKIEAVEPAEGGGQVVRFRYKTKKGIEKVGYANTKTDKINHIFSLHKEAARREAEQQAAASVPGAKTI